MLLSCAWAQAQQYEGVVEKSVALVGNDIIMLSEIESEAQMMRARGLTVDKSARCEILENFLVSKLFLTQAKLDSLINVKLAPPAAASDTTAVVRDTTAATLPLRDTTPVRYVQAWHNVKMFRSDITTHRSPRCSSSASTK